MFIPVKKSVLKPVVVIVLFLFLLCPARASAKQIVIGDSRVVGMHQTVGDQSATWIARVGEGYPWFSATAVPKADRQVTRGSRVIIMIGTNDLGDAPKYAALINRKGKNWIGRGAGVTVCAVGPVDDRRSPNAKNRKICEFNSTLRSSLISSIQYVDVYSAIVNSYQTVDGIHYNAFTYRKIWNVIQDSVGAQGGENGSSDVLSQAMSWGRQKGVITGDVQSQKVCSRGQAINMIWKCCGSQRVWAVLPFWDIGKQYSTPVSWAYQKKITSGTTRWSFSPSRGCTRAQFITFLWRAAGKPSAGVSQPFKDVKKRAYYASAVRWAYGKNIVAGTSKNTCRGKR